MSVDYSANFGIGYRLDLDEEFVEENWYPIKQLTKKRNIVFIEWGDTYENENYYGVIIKDPAINDPTMLEFQIMNLDEFLEEKNMSQYISGEVGLIGGLRIN